MKPHRFKVFVITAVLLFQFGMLLPQSALAWTEHPLISYQVLRVIPEVRDAKTVNVEDLDTFLMEKEGGLATLLAAEEEWARQNLAYYRPLPEVLTFKATGTPADIRERFCHAIRINPDSRFGLYLQIVPGTDSGGRPRITPDAVTFLKNTSDWKSTTFVELKAGEMVSPLDVMTTASDEPDFGLDIGLYDDNSTEFGTIYGFGKQPFGNPNLEYSSQGPFHMGYYHESWFVSTFADFVNQTYPEYRIHLYKTLSTYAFRTGHDYWGWRFMGIGLHYIMDLTQPYHTTLLPGVRDIVLRWINYFDIIGIGDPKADAIQLVSNRHTAIEKFQQAVLQEAYQANKPDHPLLVTLRTINVCPAWDDSLPRDLISERSHAIAGKMDEIMEETMPESWVSDPTFELGTSPELDDIMVRIKQNGGEQAIDRVTMILKEILEPLSGYMCSYIYSIMVK
ncbi:MAG: hypothetical protein NT072_05870 [Deltaproteobacteria bacterium]|nr:hypothetical protein [Deltaproteobacteria bacterium]